MFCRPVFTENEPAVLQVKLERALHFSLNVQLQTAPSSVLQFCNTADSRFSQNFWSSALVTLNLVSSWATSRNCSLVQRVVAIAAGLGNCYYVVSDNHDMWPSLHQLPLERVTAHSERKKGYLTVPHLYKVCVCVCFMQTNVHTYRYKLI